MNNRLAIGTAQFGQPYGIANHAGQVSFRDADAILSFARSSGIDTVDTAIAYGESERRLGEIGLTQLQVVSKLPGVPPSCMDVSAWVNESVRSSLGRLKVSKLHGLLLHCPDQLLGLHGAELYRAMQDLKMNGLVEKIGISIYGPEELDALWTRFKFDLVQAPFNIIDRRLAKSGWLERLHQSGIEVHVRSIFLQGLLLMSALSRPPAFNKWSFIWKQWDSWLEGEAISPLQACVGFPLSRPEIDRVVVGVDNPNQMQEILASVATPCGIPPETLVSEDTNLINPSLWSRS